MPTTRRAGTVISGVLSSPGSNAPAMPSAVTGAVVPASVTLDDAQQLYYLKVRVNVTFADTREEFVEIWLSKDNGTNWEDIGQYPASGASLLQDFATLAPADVQNWKVAVAAGNVDSVAVFDNAKISATFSTAADAAPSATGVTAASATAPFTFTDVNGNQNWAIKDVQWTDPGAVDPYCFQIYLTFQCTDVSGTPAPADQGGTEVLVAMFGNDGVTHHTNNISSYGFNPPDPTTGLDNVYTYAQLRLYATNRNASGWQDTPNVTLQTTCWSGASFSRQNFGTPAGQLNNGRGVQTDTNNIVINPGFEFPIGWTYLGGAQRQHAAGASGEWRLLIFSQNYALERYTHKCVPGKTYTLSAYWACDTGANGFGELGIQYYDNSGGISTYQPIVTVPPPGPTTFVQFGGKFTVPIGMGSFAIKVTTSGNSFGTWYADDITCQRAVPLSSSTSGVSIDANGNLVLNQSWTIGIAGNNVIINNASVQSANLAAGSLGDLTKYSPTVRAIGIVSQLPVLPDTIYPQGAIVFSLANGKAYRNVGGAVVNISVTSPGTGYTNGALFTISGGGGSGASGKITINPATGALASVSVANPGAAFTTASFSFSVPGGSGGVVFVSVVTSGLLGNAWPNSPWVAGSDPQDLFAGTIAAGVIYAGQVNAIQVNAGTLFAVNMSGGTLHLSLNGVDTDVNNTSENLLVNGMRVMFTGGSSPVYIAPGTIRSFTSTAGGFRFALEADSSASRLRLMTPANVTGPTLDTQFGLTIRDPSGTSRVIADTVGQITARDSAGAVQVLLSGSSGDAVFNGVVTHGGIPNFAGSTSATANAGAATLPGNPVGFLLVTIAGVTRKLPYYAN